MDRNRRCAELIRDIFVIWRKKSGTVVEKHGMTTSQAILIMYLNQAGKDGMTMDQIEEKLNLTQSTASRLVSHYEEIGAVERFGKPGDKRFRKVRLTAQGQLWADEWDRSMADAEKQLLSGMSEEEIRIFYDILCKAYHNCRNIEFR